MASSPVDAADMGAGPDAAADRCEAGIFDESPLHGRVFVDVDGDVVTRYRFGFEPGADAPVVEPAVELRAAGSDRVVAARSCADGRYGFDGPLAPGDHLRSLPGLSQPGQVVSSNQAYRLPRAIAEGSVQVVTIGDSVPKLGPDPLFPAQLSSRLQAFGATVDDQNVAVPGSTSGEWLPGGGYFEGRLGPLLAEADVVMISLGGNDFFALVDEATASSNPDVAALQARFEEVVDQVLQNVVMILDEIRQRAPQADIVWVLYPNFARSSAWKALVGDFIGVVDFTLDRTLRQVRARLVERGVLVADMLEATRGVDLDPLLFDEVHLSGAGHDFYAEEIFRVLGGVTIEEGGASVEGDVALAQQP